MTKVALSSSVNSTNFLNQLRNSCNNEVLQKQMHNLYTRNDKERGAMLIQSVEPTTRGAFNFSVFSPTLSPYKSPNKVIKDFKSFDITGNKQESNINQIFDDENKKNFDSRKKLNEIIKVSNETDNRDDTNRKISLNLMTDDSNYHIKNQEFYREVVLEKSKIENILRKELVEVAEKLYLKKIERNKALEDLTVCTRSLHKIKEDFMAIKDSFDTQVRKLSIQLQNSLTPKNSNNDNRDAKLLNSPSSKSLASSRKNNNKNKSIKDKSDDQQHIVNPSSIINSVPIEFKSEFLKKKYAMDDDLKLKEKQYEEQKAEIQSDLEARTKKVNILEIEVNLLKNHFYSLSKDQRVYYLDLLQQGIDVR